MQDLSQAKELLKTIDSDFAVSISENDFRYFCKFVLGGKLGKFHEDIIDKLVYSEKHLAVLAPRGHFKTTIMSIFFPLWILWRNRNSGSPKKILIVSSTEAQANAIMDQIKTKILTVPLLKEELLPDNTSASKWSASDIETKQGHEIKCRPFNDSIRGTHVDYCICDDILRDETTNDEKSKALFYSVLFPVVQAKRGKHLVIGTPMSLNDLFHEFKDKRAFDFLHYECVIADDSGVWLKPLFPEHYSLEQLREIKDSMPSYQWMKEYMCRPIGGDFMLFPDAKVSSCLKIWVDLNREYDKADVIGEVDKYLGVDLALSESTSADWTVLVEVWKSPNLPLLVRRLIRYHGKPSAELMDEIKSMHASVGYSRIAIEQIGLGYDFVKRLIDDPLIGSFIVPVMYKKELEKKQDLLSRLVLLIDKAELALVSNDVLVQELGEFAFRNNKPVSLGKHDDTVSALMLAVYASDKNAVPVSVSFI